MALSRKALISLSELQDYIKNTESGKEDFLKTLINSVSFRFDEFCKRNLIEAQRTEYYDGDSRDSLFLNQAPIPMVNSLFDDTERDFGSSTQITLTNTILYEEDGIIRLFDDESKFVRGRQNIKITYWAGYKTLEVFAGENDKIDFKEGAGSELTATLTAARYDIQGMADHLKSKLDTAGTKTYFVEFDFGSKHFKIRASDGSQLSFLWNSGTNASTNAAWLLGFNSSADDEDETEVESDYSVYYLPDDIKHAAKEQCAWWFKQSFQKDGIIGIQSRSVAAQNESQSFARDPLLPNVKEILGNYIMHPYLNRIE